MESFLQDLRQALRVFLRSPVFTTTAVAARALGIGTNTAIFSLINTVLLSPVRYLDPDRVVLFATTTPEGPVYAASDPKFNLWRQQDSVFQDVSGYQYGIMNLTSGNLPEQIQFEQVTGGYFRLSGLPIGIKAEEPMVFVTAAVLLGVVAFLSVWLAAARLSRIGPADALRSE